MRDLAFIRDPDDYWIEVIPRGGSAQWKELEAAE